MRRGRNVFLFFLLVLILFQSFPAYAAATKIKNVKVKIGIEDLEDFSDPEFYAEAKSDKYEVSDVNIISGFYEQGTGPAVDEELALEVDTDDDMQVTSEGTVCEIELCAEDDYYFGTMEQTDIKLSGVDGICTKAVRKDSGSTLVLTVELSLDEILGTIGDIFFSDTGQASWTPAFNASTYALTLYQDGKKRGKVHITAGESFDYTPLLTEPGSYYFKIYPLNASGKKGVSVESGPLRITTQEAEKNRQHYPDAECGWKKDDVGWWYQETDRCYLQANWLEENGFWYYFGANGYLVQNDWRTWKNSQYYLGEDGAMLVSAQTPDGYQVDSEGRKVRE